MLPNERKDRFTIGDIRHALQEHFRLQEALDAQAYALSRCPEELKKALKIGQKEMQRRQRHVGECLRKHGQAVTDDLEYNPKPIRTTHLQRLEQGKLPESVHKQEFRQSSVSLSSLSSDPLTIKEVLLNDDGEFLETLEDDEDFDPNDTSLS